MSNLNDEYHYDERNDMSEVKEKLEACEPEGRYADELKDLIKSYGETCEYVYKYNDLKDEIEENVREECKELEDVFSRIIDGLFTDAGQVLLYFCENCKEDEGEKKEDTVEKFVECMEKCLDQFNRVIEQIYDVTNELLKFKLDYDISLEEFNESVIEEATDMYDTVRSYVVKLTDVFEKYYEILNDCLTMLHKKGDLYHDMMLTEEMISGDYWCIYQPGSAIFGTGKTEDEAWEDAKEWADDVSDPNWKQSFKAAQCTGKLYDYVNQHGTPETWEEVDGVLALEDEVKELNEAVKSQKH